MFAVNLALAEYALLCLQWVDATGLSKGTGTIPVKQALRFHVFSDTVVGCQQVYVAHKNSLICSIEKAQTCIGDCDFPMTSVCM